MASLSRSPVRMRTTASMVETKILPSPMRPGARGVGDGFDNAVGLVVVDDHLEPHLGQEVDDIFGAAVQLGVALLPAEALGLGHGDAADPGVVERFLDLIELERLDDGFDFFHSASSTLGA